MALGAKFNLGKPLKMVQGGKFISTVFRHLNVETVGMNDMWGKKYILKSF